jgi:hypothetical protein
MHDGVYMPGTAAPSSIKVQSVAYVVPDIKLVRDDGREVSLPEELNDGRPVLLNFIFTSCGSTCPLMSQVFAEFQRKLGAKASNVHLMSISIDPEEDTPARLAEYGHRFGAGAAWQHYTGLWSQSRRTARLHVYRGDKMSHAPATQLRRSRAAVGAWRAGDSDDLLQGTSGSSRPRACARSAVAAALALVIDRVRCAPPRRARREHLPPRAADRYRTGSRPARP